MVLASRLSLLALCLLCLSCGEATVDHQDTKNARVDAKAIYTMHCVACHGEDGSKGVSGAANLAQTKLDSAALKKVILYGTKNGMMPYRDILDAEKEIPALVTYIQTLKR